MGNRWMKEKRSGIIKRLATAPEQFSRMAEMPSESMTFGCLLCIILTDLLYVWWHIVDFQQIWANV